MKALKMFYLMIIAILVSVFCIASCLIMIPTYAQSSEPTVVSLAFSGQYPQTQGYSGEVVSGLVLDADGMPVPGAIVTLWQNGSPWQLNTGLAYNGGDVNPRTSGIYGNNEGSFLFGLVAPGVNTVTAEKDGFLGSATIIIDNVTIHSYSKEDFDLITKSVNITLQGYRVPVLSREQMSYTGGVAGTLKTVQEYWMEGNVSLWHDGKLVTLPENPQSTSIRDYQGRKINFLFEHLAPGQYEVVASSRGGDYTDNATINVTDHIEYVDIRSFAAGMVAPELWPVALPLASMGLAALIIVRLRKS